MFDDYWNNVLSDEGDGALLVDDVLGARAAVVDGVYIGALGAFDAAVGVAVPLEVEVFGVVDLPTVAVVDEDDEVLLLVGGEDAESVVVGPLGSEGVGSVEGELGDGEREVEGVGAVEGDVVSVRGVPSLKYQTRRTL